LETARAEAENSARGQGDRAAWACANVVHRYAGIATNACFNARDAVQSHALGDRLSGPLTLEVQALMGPPWEAEAAAQCDLVRDIFGNPFRPIPPKQGKRVWEEQKRHWLEFNGGSVQSVAKAIYEENRFADLLVLADALEEAGCADAGLLGHLRGPGPHVRGCWAVDLLLGKG
jgi:hypothetical protein